MKAVRLFAAVFLLLVGFSAMLPRLWTPDSYETQLRELPDAPPSVRFPLGTDSLGRNRLSRLLYGTRISLALGPAAALLSCIAAALVGGLAGLLGGWTERVILASVDLFLSLPWLFLLLTVRAMLPLNAAPMVSLSVTFALLGLLSWPAPARVIRAAIHRLRDSDFVLQARACGVTPWRLISRQLIPNVVPVLIAQFWVSVPVFILAEATLGMLGLGISEPLPSWGSMLREMEGANVVSQPWIAAPVVLLAAVVGCLQLIFPREDYSV